MGTALVGRDSLRSFWTNIVRSGRVTFDLQVADVVAADSIAVERGHYTLKFTASPQAPMPSFEDEGKLRRSVAATVRRSVAHRLGRTGEHPPTQCTSN